MIRSHIRYIKKYIQFNSKNPDSPINKWAKDLKQIFVRSIYR